MVAGLDWRVSVGWTRVEPGGPGWQCRGVSWGVRGQCCTVMPRQRLESLPSKTRSAVQRSKERSERERTWSGLGCQRTAGELVLVGKDSFDGSPALAVFPLWWRGACGLAEFLLGGAQSCFQGLEFLCLCGHGLLPGGALVHVAWGGECSTLFMDVLVEGVEVAVELEQVVELRHEVDGDGAAGRRQNRRALC